MFHLLAYLNGAVASATPTDIAPIQDDIFTIQNGHFVPQSDLYVLWAKALGLDSGFGQIVTPSLRQVSSPYIRPINASAVPLSLDAVADYRRNPIMLRALEEIEVLATQGSGGAIAVLTLLAVSTTMPSMSTNGTVFTMRGASSTTAGAGVWSSLAMTWADVLPAGTYEVVGCENISATALANRVIFENQVFRPGGEGHTDVSHIPSQFIINGGLGSWGRFTANRMPIIQALCGSGDSAHEVYLHFVRIA